MILFVVYVLCASVLLIHLYFRYCRAGRLMVLIPGPAERFFIGNVLLTAFEDTVQLFNNLRQWSKTYGKLYKIQGFCYRTIHISHPDDVELLLSSSVHTRKDIPYTFLHDWLGDGLLVSNGKKWQQRRKLLTPAFHFNILNNLFQTFCDQTEKLLDTVEKEVGENKTDLTPLISKFSLRTMCETTMGTKIADDCPLAEKYRRNAHGIGECYARRLTMPWYFIDFIYKTSSLFKLEKTFIPDLHNFTRHLIQNKREALNKKNENKTPIMLDILLEDEKKANIDENGIREEVDTLFFEGYDTTATAIVFMIMRIANEPEIQNRIYEELQSIYGNTDKKPTIRDLSKMKYLDCCIKESLRLYCSVPFIGRYVTEEITLAGYKIPKNSYCDVHIYDVHRNPEIYPDPEKFIPERFLPDVAAKRHPYAYIPFSAGPRNCIGQKFALLEIKTVMSSLLWKYRLEAVTRTEDLVFVADMILRVNHPIYVRFCHRML